MSTATKPMTILEHIRAGHYPVDDRGRALVPTVVPNETVTILATDKPGLYPIVGWSGQGCINQWTADSKYLCPPAPRRVKETCYLILYPDGAEYLSRTRFPNPPPGWQTIELVGERLVSWPDVKGEEGL